MDELVRERDVLRATHSREPLGVWCAGGPPRVQDIPPVPANLQELDQRAQLRRGVVKVGALHSPIGINFERHADGRVVKIFTDRIDLRGVGRKEKTRAGGGQPAVGIAVNVGEPRLRTRCGLRGVRGGEASHPGPVASRVRPRTTEEVNVRESLDEDNLDSLEVVLTRIDSSDEEPLVRPTIGRNVLRKVGVNSDSVPLLSSQVARRHNRFEAFADSSAAPPPPPPPTQHQKVQIRDDTQNRSMPVHDGSMPSSI